MFKKLFFFVLILFILYILAIFNSPTVANQIGTILNIKGFNDFVIDFKSTLDGTVTDIPTESELEENFNKALSGAIDFKNDVINGAEKVKDGVDSVRNTLSGAVETYNEVKGTIDKTTETIKNTADTINSTVEKINDVSNSINNSLSGSNLK